MSENGGLYAYYKSFNRLVSELGVGALSNEVQVHYFIAGLNSNAVQNTNLNLHMHTFYENKPTSTVTDLYAEAYNKVIRLSKNDKTNSGNGGYGKRAGPGNIITSNQYDGRTQSQQRDNRSKQQPKKDKSAMPDTVCDKCHHTGHSVANCKFVIYQNRSNLLGRGNHHQVTTGPKETLKRPLQKRSLGRSRLQWLRRSHRSQHSNRKRRRVFSP
jgi:hypothetical protein